jgi:hypothetical protein
MGSRADSPASAEVLSDTISAGCAIADAVSVTCSMAAEVKMPVAPGAVADGPNMRGGTQKLAPFLLINFYSAPRERSTSMLRSLIDLTGYTIRARDGDIGSVSDFLFDDERWVVRYLVAETGSIFTRRHALISPISFREADWPSQRFHLALTKDEVNNSPEIDHHRPVSRQRERELHGYYGYSLYWGYPGLWGMAGYPGTLAPRPHVNPAVPQPAQKSDQGNDDVHLRSANELHNYDIAGVDDSIGHVEDFVVDDASWALRFIVVDTSNWWFGKKVLIAPEWATRLSWDSKTMHLDMTRRQIENSPTWDPKQPINRAYEERLYDYYGRPAYYRDT